MKILYGAGAALALGVALAACGGGGSSLPAAPVVVPTSTIPITTQAVGALSTTATSAPIALGTIINGSSATVSLPVASGAAKATLTLRGTLPTGAVTPQSLRKVPAAIGGSGLTELDYITLTVNANVTISSTPAFTFNLAQAPAAGTQAYMALFDVNNATAGWNIVDGPATITGTAISFKAQTIFPSITLNANDTYIFALVTGTGVTTPAPIPTFPGASGSTLGFSGTQTVADTYNYPTPSPLPNTTVTSQVTQSVTVASSPFPSGTPETTDLHEVTTVAAPLASQIITTDAWYGATVSGAAPALGLYGQTSADNANNVMTVLYLNPQIVDLLTEANGASWTNSPAATTNATFADGETLARTDNADGSYAETTTVLGIYTFVAAGAADNSGSYTGTGLNAYGIQSITASAPSNGVIAVSALLEPSGPVPSPTPIVFAAPQQWFSATTPYSEKDAESTGVTYPTQCNVPAQYGFAGGHISQTIERIDPIIGTDEKIQNDTYTGPIGPICATMSDTLTENYDYLDDTIESYPFTGNPYSFADYSGRAVHVRTTTEVLTLSAAPSQSAAQARALQRGTIPESAIRAARAQLALSVATERHRLVAKFVRHIQAAIRKGGLK